MINSGLGIFITLAVLGTVAIFGYYNGFLALIQRRVSVGDNRMISGWQAMMVGCFQIGVAIIVSAIAMLLYFGQAV